MGIGIRRRWVAWCGCVVLIGVGAVPEARGMSPLLSATATAVVPPLNGGALSVGGGQIVGFRFTLASAGRVDGIGGLFSDQPEGGTLWGAIVRLTSASDYPDSMTMTTPDVLAHVTFVPPAFPGADVAIPIGPVSLSAGRYAVVFGGAFNGTTPGDFGSTGQGGLPNYGTAIGTPSMFTGQADNGQWGALVDAPNSVERMTVYGVLPEPGSAGLLAVAGAAHGLIRRRRRERV